MIDKDYYCVLLREKKAENNSNIIKEEVVAIFDKLLAYKCMTPTQHKKINKEMNLT